MSRKEHIRWMLLFIVLIGVICWLPVHYAWGAARYIPYRLQADNFGEAFDSAIFVIRFDAGGLNVVEDSQLFISFPVFDSHLVNSDSNYTLSLRVSYSGDDGVSAEDIQFIPAQGVQIASLATVKLRHLSILADTTVPAFLVQNLNAGASASGMGIYALSGVAALDLQGGGSPALRAATSTGNAATFVGDNNSAGIYTTGKFGIRATTKISGGAGIWAAHTGGVDTSGYGLWASASGPGQGGRFENTFNGHGLYVLADSTASTMKIVNTGGGIALDVRTDSTKNIGAGDAVQFVAGGTWAGQANYGFEIEGGSYFHGRENSNEDAWRAYSDNGRAIYMWSDSSDAFYLPTVHISQHAVDTAPAFKIGGDFRITDTFYIADTFWIPGGGGSGADTTAILALGQNHPGVFYGPGAGSGGNSVTYYAIDTSDTPEAIMGVTLTSKTMAGVQDGLIATNSSGYGTFTAPTEQLVFLGYKTGYVFTPDTNNITGTLTDTLFGYNWQIVVGSPSDSSMCRCYGLIYNDEWLPISGAKITIKPPKGVTNLCDSTIVLREQERTTYTDDTGYFQIDLVRSECYSTAADLQYSITVEKRNKHGILIHEVREQKFVVPDTTTYRITF